MTARARTLTPHLWKEVRALAPTLGAALAAVLVGGASEDPALISFGLLGFAFGSIALGAQSMGHEFHSRTVGLLLTHPISRARTYLVKLVVLALMIATLTTITLPVYGERLLQAASRDTQPAMLLMVATCGLFLAPFLTVLSRSTLAAVVFTIAIPGLLATAGDLVGVWIYGPHNALAVDHFKEDVFWRGIFTICGLAGIAGWWMFARLEVIEGHRDIALPGWLTFAPRGNTRLATRPGHFVRALLMKELRLQQIPYVLAALYAATVTMLPLLDRMTPTALGDAKGALTALYAGFVALLIGSLSSAQERHLGTLEWQTLQPVAGWKQWSLKVTVAWALAIVLGLVLPIVLGVRHDSGRFRSIPAESIAATLICLTTVGLYLSTLCRNSMSALVLTFPMIVASAAVSSAFQRVLGSLLYQSYIRAGGPPRRYIPHDMSGPLLLFAVGLVAVLLSLAFVNHRTSDRSAVRTAKQALAIGAYVAIGLIAVAAWTLR